MVAQHITTSLDRIREIFEKASERIEKLQPGEKVPATVLAEEIADQYGMTGPQLYPTLRFLFDGYPGIIVRRGAHGGIIRPLPEDQNKKKSKASTTDAKTSEPSSETESSESSEDSTVTE